MSSVFRSYQNSNQRSDRSARDRLRHKDKIKQSIRDNIGSIISDESIIGKNKNKIIKVPLRSIKEYRFVYGDNSPGVAQGNGQVKPGDVVKQGKGEPGQGGEGGGGNEKGVDAFETEVSLEELINIMFEDLELPDLEKKALKKVMSDDARKRKGLRHKGIRPRLNKKATAKNRIKRRFAAMRTRKDEIEEDGKRFPFHTDDMRFFHIVKTEKEVSNAVVICIMDTSGSMGTVKKYLARSFYFLLYQFVRMKYQHVEVVFIAHHTEAKEVNEDEFFHKVESGGTYISSGYEKALEVIDERYHPSLWNVYAFHCSDGDNFYSDNEKALQAANALCDACNLFGYGEIKPTGSAYYSGTMLEVFKQVQKDNFQMVTIERKEDLWDGLKKLLEKDKLNQKSGSHYQQAEAG